MRRLRHRISHRLLESGTEMAFDHRQIARGTLTAGYENPVATQALFFISLVSRLKIRLGLFLLPPP